MKWTDRIRQAWASRRASRNSVQPVTPPPRTNLLTKVMNRIRRAG